MSHKACASGCLERLHFDNEARRCPLFVRSEIVKTLPLKANLFSGTRLVPDIYVRFGMANVFLLAHLGLGPLKD